MRRLLPALAFVTATAACGAVGTQSLHPGSAAHLTSARIPARQSHPVVLAAKAAGPKVGVRHVFVIVLENESYQSTYATNPNPYMNKIRKQGTLLTQYYATGHHSLDNYLSMISGQAPNATTSADCAGYNAIPGDAPLNSHGQETSAGGCIYPKNVNTLANQLTSNKISWRGWMEDMGNSTLREQSSCGVPRVVAGIDDTQTATATDQYAARHNPFVYFKSILDDGTLCASHVKPLSGLPTALKKTATTPQFNFITPNLCDDGHDAPCHGKDSKGFSDGGLLSVDHFLSVWVPKILHSPAYKKNGLLIITSDESDSTDASSCCGEKPGPTDPSPGDPGAGGGRVGTLVLGHCVAANHLDGDHYNHYSLLRSLENLYGITKGGTDHKGHIGYAAASGLRAFGSDVFSKCKSKVGLG